ALAQMLVAGKIDARQASTLSKAENFPTMDVLRAASALREASAPPSPDANTPKEIEQDLVYGTPAKPEEYRIQWKAPGDPTPLSAEMKQFDTNARGWLADAALSKENCEGLIKSLEKMRKDTHAMTADQLEAYKDTPARGAKRPTTVQSIRRIMSSFLALHAPA